MRTLDPAAFVVRHGGIEIRRVGASLGAEITGVDLGADLSNQAFETISAALVEHGLLIFREQPLSSDRLMALGRRFGELSVHPFAPRGAENPELIKFKNDASLPPYGTDVWHSDETFRASPPMATILCAKEVPQVGGDTMYASMTAAYDGLSVRTKALIEGLEAVHDIVPFKKLFADSRDDRMKLQAYERDFPPQRHPVVRVHSQSGRKALFVNAQFTTAIVGMDDTDSRSLLELLFRQAQTPEFQFRLRWHVNTLAIWDNRSLQHYAIHDYYPQRRFMERVTICGGPVEGPICSDLSSVKRSKFDAPPGTNLYGGHKPQ